MDKIKTNGFFMVVPSLILLDFHWLDQFLPKSGFWTSRFEISILWLGATALEENSEDHVLSTPTNFRPYFAEY